MRLTSRWLARKPQNENKVPFKAVLPLQLKDRVSSKFQSKTSDRGCLYEMTLLLTCLDENAYENKLCLSQLKSLQACYERFKENVKRTKIESDMPVPNSKNLNHNQVTNLLRRYPTI